MEPMRSNQPEPEREQQLADEIAGLNRLHEFATRVLQTTHVHALLDETLTVAEAIMHADMGNVQLLDGNGALRIACQHGFSEDFLDFFDHVTGEEGACGAAMHNRQQVFVEDVEQSPIFRGTPALGVMLRAGARAVQSTPIITRGGRLLGMFSTHFRTPTRRNERDLRLVSLLAAQAADLIERVDAKEELLGAKQQLEMITENMAAAVTRCSRDLRYVWVSQAYAGWLQRPKEEIEGRSILDVIGAQGFEEIRPYMERVLAGEKVDYTKQVHFLSAGSRWINAVYVPTRAHDQRVDGWIAVVTDITEYIQQKQHLRKANLHLARANQDLKHFVFAASHDLREPLRMIAMYSQLLVRGYMNPLDEEASTCVRFITEGTNRMQQLLTGLLAYARLIGDGEPEASTVADLNAAFRKAVENCLSDIEECHATIVSDSLPTLPGHEPHFIELFQNLLSNAIKYRSHQPLHIHVCAINEDHGWRVAVADNGIGIEPEFHQHIFGVFKRLHGPSIPGTGIGLAICQRVVDRYGGRIWVESQKDQGATFYFTLPSAQGAMAHEQ